MRWIGLPLLLGISTTLIAATRFDHNPKQGWHWYDDPVATTRGTKTPAVESSSPTGNSSDRCRDPQQWTTECGFVIPRTAAFQEHQRDALLNNLFLSPDLDQAVLEAQKYTYWMMSRAVRAGDRWAYSMVQHPELNTTLHFPVSQIGLRLVGEVEEATATALFHFLRDNATLIYFSREDCLFCRTQAPLVQRLADQTQIPLYHAPLDGHCSSTTPLNQAHCGSAEEAHDFARRLQVTLVPDLWLYVEPDGWIRLASGVVTLQEMRQRLLRFFREYRQITAEAMVSTAAQQQEE